VQANLSAIRRALLEQGDTCPVMVITRADAPAEPDVVRPTGPIDLLFTLLHQDFGIVHLHIGGNATLRLMLLALVCAWLPARKSVLTLHSGGYPRTEQGRNASPNSLRGFVFRQMDRVIAVNTEIVEMLKRFGVAEDRVRLIYPHAIPRVDPSIALPDEIQEFLDRHGRVLVSVGLLEPEYDLPTQIKLLEALRQEFGDVGLIMVGSGSLEPDLRQRIAGSPEREHILLSGDLDHDFTLRLLTECDLMLRTTKYDGDSISVREALSLGVPVMATDNGMRPEGVNLVPLDDPAALRTAASQMLRSERPASASETDLEDNIAKVLALYAELSPSAR
jgi:glycosyltransferase involved in cell wall biosynthesis